MDHTIAEIQGLSVLLADDVVNDTLLQEAIQKKRFDVAEWLCKHELVYISKTNEYNGRFSLLNITDNIWEALNYYVYSRNYSVITLHLKYVNMHKAIGESAVLYWLLQHGGNLEELDSNGRTLLHLAIQEKLFDVFYLLLEMGADINAQNLDGDTPLHLAVENNEEMAHSLIQHGCDIDAQNHDGHTPLFLAVDCNNEEIICMLLCYNANTEIGYEGHTPLIHAMRCVGNNNIILEILLAYQYDINAPTIEGFNVLYYAVICHSPLEAEIIRRGGSLPDPTKCSESFDVMHYAVNRNEMSLFKLAFATFDMKLLKLRHFYDFIGNNAFPRNEWIKYLYLILRSEFAKKLSSLGKRANKINNVRFYKSVVTAFVEKNVREKDRIKILKILFEQKIPIHLYEVDEIYDFYGFNGEIELLFKMPIKIVGENCCAVKFILNFKLFTNDGLKDVLSDYFHPHLTWIAHETMGDSTAREILALGRFISLRQHLAKFKDYLCEMHHGKIKKFMKVINEMPIVPSLEELSRNAVRAAIGRKFHRKNLSFYQKCLNKLPLPSTIMDIVRLKVPIYKDFTPLYLEEIKIESQPDLPNSVFY